MTAKGHRPGTRYAWTSADYGRVMAMTAEGCTQRAISAATGIPPSVVSRMVRGAWTPPEAHPRLGLLGRSPLTAVLQPYLDAGVRTDELTVQTPPTDPFRQDTGPLHEAGRWLRDTAIAMGVVWGSVVIHLRGLHYKFIGQPKPDGTPYANDYNNWQWLYGTAGKAARWLGYVAFGDIADKRNAEPVVRIMPPVPEGAVWVRDEDEEVGDADQYAPYASLSPPGYEGRQRYRLAIVGEKSSLEEVLGPIATAYGADLYLPTGDISDTQIYRMALAAARDGRELIGFYVADCDPGGWNMGIALARKLQGFRVLLAQDGLTLDFRVYRVALTPGQVRDLGLPSTPLKDSERRADRWRDATGVEQTEVDALMALRPGELDRMMREAMDPFFDHTLAGRTRDAIAEWKRAAQQVIDDGMAGDRAEADGKLDAARDLVAEAISLLATSADDDDLPEFEPPEWDEPSPGATGRAHGSLLVSSAWDFAEQCRALRESRAYGLAEQDEEELP